MEKRDEQNIDVIKDYVFLHPNHLGAGLFSYVWQVLRGMYEHPDLNYYIKFGPECSYFDNKVYEEKGIDNVWDYYFEQPHSNSMPSQDKIVHEFNMELDTCSEYRDIYLDPETYKIRRIEYFNIINKYIKLLPHVNYKLDSFFNDNFKGKKVLGLHCRGTDHPDKLPMDFYLDKIKKHIDDYDILFVASDEQSRAEYIRDNFKDKVVLYPTFRSASTQPLHLQRIDDHSKYLIGEEVIIETYLLSKCDFLLCCGGSNVNFYVRSLNTNLDYEIFHTPTI